MPTELPRWPIAALFVPFPLWWALGLADAAWIPIAALMALLLVRRGHVHVPRGTGLWLLFLLLMLVSVIGIDSAPRLIGFGYRALQYLAVTVAFVYVYNARKHVGVTAILGLLTVFWVWVVAGGWVGVLAPGLGFRTPLGYLLPAGLQANELVGEMTFRRVTQWNPESYFEFAPRPSAPFIYTNGWGNAYSLLLPLVIAYLTRIPKDWRFFALVILIPVSFVPALLTLNRGMFLGLAVAAGLAALRLAAAGRASALLGLAVAVVVGVGTGLALGLQERLLDRLTKSSTTADRFLLYAETISRSLESPLFGYGAPRPSTIEGLPSLGTQGQVWTVLFSHGIPALIVFVAALAGLFVATWRWRTFTALAVNTILGVLLVEIVYYGVSPNGLMIAFVAAAAVLPASTDRRWEPGRLRRPRAVQPLTQGAR